jgi:hypothetical protein
MDFPILFPAKIIEITKTRERNTTIVTIARLIPSFASLRLLGSFVLSVTRFAHGPMPLMKANL